MNLQPSEFIALTNLVNPQRIATYNTVPGTVVRLRNHIFVPVDAQKGAHQWIHTKTGRSLSHEPRMRGDTTNLPVILFDPLDTDTASTQFECFTPECRRIVMDSLNIEPGTVICVGAWEAMRVVGNGERNELAWVGYDGRTYTHEEFANTVRSTHDVVRVVHYGIT